MKIAPTRDPQEFAAHARGFLEQRIERNVLATVLRDVLRGRHAAGSPLFAYGLDGEDVCFAALRTPPMPMLVTELDAADADALVELWLEADPELPGVNGPLAGARAIAAAWAARTGGATHRRMGEGMHALDRVRDPPRPALGALQPAGAGERALLLDWLGAFAREAGLIHGDWVVEHLDARLARGGMFVWVDGGPVSMVGTQAPVAGVVRVGPVFTPPEHRRRGYAGAAVAAASRHALEHGASRCLLFTDLANATSNKIYAEVGYRRLADWEEHSFAPPCVV